MLLSNAITVPNTIMLISESNSLYMSPEFQTIHQYLLCTSHNLFNSFSPSKEFHYQHHPEGTVAWWLTSSLLSCLLYVLQVSSFIIIVQEREGYNRMCTRWESEREKNKDQQEDYTTSTLLSFLQCCNYSAWVLLSLFYRREWIREIKRYKIIVSWIITHK